MVKHDARSLVIKLALYPLLALGIWLALMHEFRLDDSFITYRYAQNAAQGIGLVYNAGDATLSTTAPLYALLLATLSLAFADFHVLGGLIGTLSIGAGGAMLALLLREMKPAWIAWWGGALYTLSTPLWLALGMETPLWLALTLGATLAARYNRWALSGFIMGLATITRPDAGLPSVLLGAAALLASAQHYRASFVRWWRPVIHYSIAGLLPLIAFGVWAWATYGSPLPATLDAKGAQAVLGITGMGPFVTVLEGLGLIVTSLLRQSPFYLLVALLALIGLASRPPWPVVLIAAWGALHLIAYALMEIAPYRWYYAPLIPGVLLLSASGLRWLQQSLTVRRFSWMTGALALAAGIAPIMSFGHIQQQMTYGGPTDVMLPIIDWDAYRQVGEWINAETAVDARIGVAEVGQVGFYAERWMTDYLGLLQPEVAELLRRGDLYSWMIQFAPDYLVFQRFRGAPLVLYNYLIGDDPWFRHTYQEQISFDDARYVGGPVSIFARIGQIGTFEDHPADAQFDGLHLLGYGAAMGERGDDGIGVRVRLDWDVTGALPESLHIAVKALDVDGMPGFDGDYPARLWEGVFSTWHGFVLPVDLPPSMYTLLVGVGPTGGPYTEHVIGAFAVLE